VPVSVVTTEVTPVLVVDPLENFFDLLEHVFVVGQRIDEGVLIMLAT